MILNSKTVELIRTNAERLARTVHSKEELNTINNAHSYEQLFSAVETLLTQTDMYFDDELLEMLDETSWKSFKATLLVYCCNYLNKNRTHVRDTVGTNLSTTTDFRPTLRL